MLPTYACRTCVVAIKSHNQHHLKSIVITDDFPQKTLSDLLFELTLINVNDDCPQNMSQHICNTCACKLKNAYDFLVQARRTNKLLLACTKSPCNVESTTLIDGNLNSRKLVEVKLESHYENQTMLKTNDGNICNTTRSHETKTELLEPLIMQLSTTKSVNFFETCDPLVIKEGAHNKDTSSYDESDEISLQVYKRKLQEDMNRKSFECKQCHKSFKRAESLNKHMLRHRAKSDWFSCDLCDQKFYRKDLLRPHLIKEHGVQNRKVRMGKVGEYQRAKEVDINRCKPNGCKIIQCMICLRKHANFSELQTHLLEHAKTSALPERTESIAEIAEPLYPDLKNVTANQLFALIRRDINTKSLARFYSITNESGYELDLDSSETESDNIETDESIAKIQRRRQHYRCELCNSAFSRKYQIYEHQRQQHAWLEAQHVCQRCTARFVSKELLEHHSNSLCKNVEKRFICKKCPIRFRWRHNLSVHTQNHKNETQAVECSDCRRTFQDQRSLTIHTRSAHADKSKLLQCQWCTRTFYSRDCFIKHLKRHNLSEQEVPLAECLLAATTKLNGTKRISCKICNLQFSRIKELRAHILMEVESSATTHKNYDSLANYSITNERGFELHIDDSETEDDAECKAKQNLESADLAYACDLCQIKCRRKYQLCHHQQLLHSFAKLPHECDRCIFKSVSKEILEHHKITQCHNTEKGLVCETCEYKFMWPENLELHMRLHRGTRSDCNIIDGNLPIKNSKKFTVQLQCPHCERTYKQQARLNMHIKDVHIDGDRKKKDKAHRYLCSLCGLETQTNSKLIIHMRRHTGEKPFKCDICDMAFTVRNEVVIHRRIHTGEKPFNCSICGKGFVRTEKLKTHLLSHSGLRPHKCTYCNMDYRYRHDLKAHLQKHIGDPEELEDNGKLSKFTF